MSALRPEPCRVELRIEYEFRSCNSCASHYKKLNLVCGKSVFELAETNPTSEFRPQLMANAAMLGRAHELLRDLERITETCSELIYTHGNARHVSCLENAKETVRNALTPLKDIY